MIKDIVVSLSDRQSAGLAGDYALSLASMLDAHLTGVAIACDPTLPGSAMGYVPIGLIDQRHDNKAAAAAIIERFAAAAARTGVPVDSRVISASVADAGEQFGRLARRFDLAIVDRSGLKSNAIDEAVPLGALFESGRPVIIVPESEMAPIELGNVMVCWDGSRSAARAIADAMPLLERAAHVDVVIITRERDKKEIEGVDMGQHLARHGFKVEINHLSSPDGNVADTLLLHTARSGADFVVMGGYGHSRLREFVLGGVTRTMLRTLAVPTMMSH